MATNFWFRPLECKALDAELRRSVQLSTQPLLTILIDRDCPLCRREEQLLRWMDRGRGRVGFDDIAAPAFDAERYGLQLADVSLYLHGIQADGTVIQGMEVFRQAYAAVGAGWVLSFTRLPLIRGLFDRLYELFAHNRLRLTGRCPDGACQLRVED